MEKKSLLLNSAFSSAIGLAFAALIACCTISCKTSPPPVNPNQVDSTHDFVNWNILFKPQTTQAQRDGYVNQVKTDLQSFMTDYNTKHGTSWPLFISVETCPCDPLLVNIVANTTIGAMASTTPPKPPGTGSSGDPFSCVNNNNLFEKDKSPKHLDTKYPTAPAYSVVDTVLLAVMDTGLDDTLFNRRFADLLWSDPSGARTLRNFRSSANLKPLDYFYDDDPNKHGSAVTSIALEAITRSDAWSNKLPKVMVMKVLDGDGKGTTFSFSCALRYASQKRATLINASLGYYTPVDMDSVLKFYLATCNVATRQIPVIAAAGNLTGDHIPPLCGPLLTLNNNKLTETHLFLPACYSDFPGFEHVISVTGLQDQNTVCYYQNYSPRYVSLGVITNSPPSTDCCGFAVSFYERPKRGYEGSSMATPVVSGLTMARVLRNGEDPLDVAKNRIGTPPTGTPATKKVLTYNSVP